MRTNKVIFIVILVIGVVFTNVTHTDEFIKFGFDGRDWELDYQAQEGSTMIFEWVPKGQSVENWNELVTAQAFRGLQTVMTPERFTEGIRDQLSKLCPSIEWNILSNRSSEVIYEWQIEYCPGQDPQYEICRVFLGKEGIYTMHYATKHIPVEPAIKQKWIALLKAATLTDHFPKD